MQPPNQHSRFNLRDLRAQILRKLGPEESKQYFYYLQKFLSLKMTKVEFDKLCVRILGRENIPLHNQFIHSILRNAFGAKSPPPSGYKDSSAQVGGEGNSADGYQRNGSHINMTQMTSGSACLLNGANVLPVSPRKARTGFRDRRSGDRGSGLGPNGKTSSDLFPSAATQSSDLIILENGASEQPDIRRPLYPNQQHEDHMNHRDNKSGIPVPHLTKMPAATGLPCSPHVHNKEQNELLVRNNREGTSTRSPLRAPLGVPFCPASTGGARRTLPPASDSRFVGALIDNALLDSLTLRERVEHIAVAHGLEGVSPDCANILNHGIDSCIKGLIRSCIELVGAKSGQELMENNAHKHENHMKLINGVKPDYQYQIQNTGGVHVEVTEQKINQPITLQDFRVAMELNPRQLGEDWPLLLDKICTRAFKE